MALVALVRETLGTIAFLVFLFILIATTLERGN